jgi:hypothetical protein
MTGRHFLVAFAVALSIVFFTPGSAFAYHREVQNNGVCNPCISWSGSGTGHYYLFSSITAHSAWPSFIADDFGNYNSDPYIPSNPTWLRTTQSTQSLIDVRQVSLGLSVCGRGTAYYTGTTITYGNIQLNTDLSYGGRNGTIGDCDFDGVVLHEIGHTQGLAHSQYYWAVMYHEDNVVHSLTSDDEAGMAAIYP